MKDDQLGTYLLYLKLSYFQEHHQALAQEAAEKNWPPLDFLSRLVEGEALRRKDRATQRRIQAAPGRLLSGAHGSKTHSHRR